MAFSLVVKHYFLIEKALDSGVQNASKLTVTGLETLIHSKLRTPNSIRNLGMDQSNFLTGQVKVCHTNCFLHRGVNQSLDVPYTEYLSTVKSKDENFFLYLPFQSGIKTSLWKIMNHNLWFIKWDASFGWSFRPNSIWYNIETTTIGKTHPNL